MDDVIEDREPATPKSIVITRAARQPTHPDADRPKTLLVSDRLRCPLNCV